MPQRPIGAYEMVKGSWPESRVRGERETSWKNVPSRAPKGHHTNPKKFFTTTTGKGFSKIYKPRVTYPSGSRRGKNLREKEFGGFTKRKAKIMKMVPIQREIPTPPTATRKMKLKIKKVEKQGGPMVLGPPGQFWGMPDRSASPNLR